MSKIPGSAHLNFTMGGLVLGGGAFGYFRKGSKVSLVAGLAVGSLFLGSGYMIVSDRHYEAHVLATGTASVLAAGMGQRFVSTGKFMPAGMVALLGVGAAAYNYKKAQDWAPTKDE